MHFHLAWKRQTLHKFTKKVRKIRKKTIGQSAVNQSYQKYLKQLCLYKCLLFLKTFLTNSNAESVKVMVQQSLLKMLEKRKRSVDGGKVFGTLLTDLFKAFDCLDHELLIAKLNFYGFSLPALRVINDYLSNRRQHTRTGNSFSDFFEFILRVP